MSMHMRLPRSIRSALRSRLLGQAALFAVSSAVVGLLAAVAKAVIARRLPTEAFGSFSFATAFLLFTAMIFEFGVFLPAARLAANEQQRGQAGNRWRGSHRLHPGRAGVRSDNRRIVDGRR